MPPYSAFRNVSDESQFVLVGIVEVEINMTGSINFTQIPELASYSIPVFATTDLI